MSRVRRVRLGELMALVGAVCVIVSLTRPWYGGASPAQGADAAGHLDAWSSFGPTIVLLIIACVLALLLVLANIFERSTALPVASAVWCTLFGLIASIAAIVRVLERPDGASALEAGAWLALAGAVLILAGGWQSMRDERPELYAAADVEHRQL
jgi:Na+/H+ antiporter NhaC